MALIMMDLFLIFGGIFLKYLCKSMKIPCVLDSDKSYSKTIFFSVISQVVEVCSLLASLTLAGGHKTYPVVALQYCRLIGGVELSLKKTAIKSIQTAKMAGLFPISTFKDQLQCHVNYEMKSTCKTLEENYFKITYVQERNKNFINKKSLILFQIEIENIFYQLCQKKKRLP